MRASLLFSQHSSKPSEMQCWGVCVASQSVGELLLAPLPFSLKLLDLYKSKQGNTTTLNISFSIENEKRATQVGLEPMTYCLLGRCSTTELPRQLNGWVESRQYKTRATSLTNLINRQTLTQHQTMYTAVDIITIIMKSTKVQTLGIILLKCSNIWIENIFACIG